MKKRLYIDIESSPEKVYVYKRYEADVVGKEERSILFSIAWKWEDEKTIHCLGLSDFKEFKKDIHDDSALVKKSWELMNEADIVLAHNGDKFDIKKLNTYFIFHKLQPPHRFQTVDTLKVARRYFSFFGNSLDDIADFFGIGNKVETKKGLWRSCLNGDVSAYKEMKRYNKHDVYLLVEIYKRMLPWIQNHPHVDPEMGQSACPNCGSTHIEKRGKYRFIAGFKAKLHCMGCGSWFQGKLEKVEE